jgi:hypothetical protein
MIQFVRTYASVYYKEGLYIKKDFSIVPKLCFNAINLRADTQGRHTGQTHRSAPTNPAYSETVGANLCVRPSLSGSDA